MRSIRLIGSGIGVMLVALACSSSTSSNTPNGGGRVSNPQQVRSEVQPVVDAECSWLFKCCSAGEIAQQLGPIAKTDCTDHLFQSATVGYSFELLRDNDIRQVLQALNYLQFGFDYSKVKIDTTALAACATKLSSKACTTAPASDHCTPVMPDTDDACATDKLFVGSLPQGADCTVANSINACAPGLVCRSVTNQGGVCIPNAAVGDLCLSDEDCGGKSVCDWTSGKCVGGASYGSACAFSDPQHPVSSTESIRCQRGLSCDAVSLKCTDPSCATGIGCTTDSNCPQGVSCVMNACGSKKKPGDTCYQTKDCEVGACDYDPMAGRSLCQANGVGGPCQQSLDCASGFCLQGLNGGACTATKTNNQPCPTGQPDECDSGKCVANVCTAVAAGDTCAFDGDCAPTKSLYCVDSKCVKAPLPNGATCSTPEECTSEACVGSKCVAKGMTGAECGLPTDAPCDDAFFCNPSAGSGAGMCAAKKKQGDTCERDIECFSNCQANNGASRCIGTAPGAATCGGTQ